MIAKSSAMVARTGLSARPREALNCLVMDIHRAGPFARRGSFFWRDLYTVRHDDGRFETLSKVVYDSRQGYLCMEQESTSLSIDGDTIAGVIPERSREIVTGKVTSIRETKSGRHMLSLETRPSVCREVIASQ
eukprot:Hpha_TRINITY_DN36540_c0_g1::TRINITY_DN36540_c0_g1_i1::g.130694::m.130694